MTATVWIALISAVAVLVGQWSTGRLFARLKAIEDRMDKIDAHLKSTDAKVEDINAEGSARNDKVQVMYWKMATRLSVLETILERRQHTREDE